MELLVGRLWLQRRERQFDVSPWYQRGEHSCSIIGVLPDETPIGRHQYHNGKTSIGKILLIAKILVRRDDRSETLCLCRAQKFAVLQGMPSTLKRGDDFVITQRMA